jgi:D-alanyl-D-alanine endopeptidase (penicillin-binding protein 7)
MDWNESNEALTMQWWIAGLSIALSISFAARAENGSVVPDIANHALSAAPNAIALPGRSAVDPIGLREQNEEPIERVYISNIPGVGQMLPEPVDLTRESSTPGAAIEPHKRLAIARNLIAPPGKRKIPRLSAAAALVVDQSSGQLLFVKNPDAVRPIASITKLMTAMVLLDSGLPLDEEITIDMADVGALTTRRSPLRPGMSLTRRELLWLALMASENPAAAALAHHYPGGVALFVQAMNDKALALGLRDTRFFEPTGLNPGNVSSPYDLAVMADAAYQYPLISELSTRGSHLLPLLQKRGIQLTAFHNSNGLVSNAQWHIGLSKTGYISEAGRCLVMQATISDRPVIMVLLSASGKSARMSDANRLKQWLEGEDDVQPVRRIGHKRRM